MRAAAKSQDALRRDTLRFALAAIHNEVVAKRRELTDEEITQVLARQAKMRRESVEAFEKAGRSELVAKERSELAILESFLPEPLSAAEIEVLARQAISESGASGAAAQGKVMQVLMPRVRGRADGRAVGEVVGRLLREGA